MKVSIDEDGSVILEVKLKLSPVAYDKLENITEISGASNIQELVAKLVTKELKVYNGINIYMNRFVEHINDRMENEGGEDSER